MPDSVDEYCNEAIDVGNWIVNHIPYIHDNELYNKWIYFEWPDLRLAIYINPFMTTTHPAVARSSTPLIDNYNSFNTVLPAVYWEGYTTRTTVNTPFCRNLSTTTSTVIPTCGYNTGAGEEGTVHAYCAAYDEEYQTDWTNALYYVLPIYKRPGTVYDRDVDPPGKGATTYEQIYQAATV